MMMHRSLRTSLSLCALCVSATIAAPTAAQCEFESFDAGWWHPAEAYQGRPGTLEVFGNHLVASSFGDSAADEFRYWWPGIQAFERAGDGWEWVGFVPSPNETNADDFADAIAIGEDWMVVAAPARFVDGMSRAGRLYAYEWIDEAWVLQGFIPFQHDAEHNELGRRLATDGELLFASYDNRDNYPFEDGAVAVFERTAPGTWELLQTIEHPDGTPQTDFAATIAASADRLAIGAPRTTIEGQAYRGAVHIYHRNGRTWTHEHAVHATSEDHDNLGGSGLAIDGTVLASTALQFGEGEDAALHVHRFNGVDAWEQEAQFAINDIPNPSFIASGTMYDAIDVDGDRIVVCRTDSRDDDFAGGSLHYAEWTGESWTMRPGIRPTSNRAWVNGGWGNFGIPAIGWFGADVAIDNDNVVVLSSSYIRYEDRLGAVRLLQTDLTDNVGFDQNQNGVCDLYDFMDGTLGDDFNLNGLEDEWEIAQGIDPDCNGNGIVDSIEPDCDGNGVPDDCEADCDMNGIADVCEADYDIFDHAPDYLEWGILHARFGGILRAIEVEEGKEIMTEFTMIRGPISLQTDLRIVVYQDPDNDLDPSNAELVYIAPVSIESHGAFQGLNVLVPNVELGAPGSLAYVGIVYGPINGVDFPYVTTANSPIPEPGVMCLLGWQEEEPDFADLSGETVCNVPFPFNFDVITSAPPVCCSTTDFNEDGQTNVNDLLLVLQSWGACGEVCAADINGDHVVDVNDLLAVITFWGSCDP